MEDTNKVTVRIYGQEYTIAGDQSREHIMKVADLVDAKMKEIGGEGSPISSVAVLAALNLASELFEKDDDITTLLEQNETLETNAKKYEALWDEMKVNFARYKEDVEKANQQSKIIQQQYIEKETQYREKDQQITTLTNNISEYKRQNDVLRIRIEDLNKQLEEAQKAPEKAQDVNKELEARCRDIESSFFDIQMENIRLKNEVENLRKQVR